MSERRPSLALRLTLWYSSVFAASCALAFVVVYVLAVATMKERRDEELVEDIDDFAALYELEGLGRIESEMALDTHGEGAEKTFFRLWAPGGKLIRATDLTAFPGVPLPPARMFETPATEPLLATLDLPPREHAVRVVYGPIAPDLYFEIGESLEEDDELVASLLSALIAPLIAVILVGPPIGWFLARRALRGVDDVTRTAAAIAGGALDQRIAALDRRVPVHGKADELARLAEVFNAMLDRIQALVVGLHEMADHLAHDLRSPLTRIRSAAEMAQASTGAGDATQPSLAATATEECDRLLELINTNLEITQTESGATHLRLSDVDLVALARDACDLFQSVAEDKGLDLSADLPASCMLRADRQRLQRVLANLLDNALKYTPPGGRVTIRLVDDGSSVRLSVADTGPGIAQEEASRIFERFYRCDRSRSEPGNGLGLSLCLANVRAHGGELKVESAPGSGSIFTVILGRQPEGALQ
jgi:signal transduction histidine kinase